MARKRSAAGRLIAVEGARGPDVAAAAAQLRRSLRRRKIDGGVSRWDASGAFYELWLGKDQGMPSSARTLLLLYASDLAFRLRWEIRPALAQKQWVIAAPYVETAVAFGEASGLPRHWLVELFRFAPTPQACYLVRARKNSSRSKEKPLEGYLEFCAAALGARAGSRNEPGVRRKIGARLDARRRGGCLPLTKTLIRSGRV